MIKLNLETKTKEQELIKAYLEKNASDILADKINNGVQVTVDGKPLISKKDLNGFFSFARDEAKKLLEKGSQCACVEDSVVYGWAVHYFEEDSIMGKLFLIDGSEFQPANSKKQPISTEKPTPKQEPKEKPEFSLFDLMDDSSEQTEHPVEEHHETIDDILNEMYPNEHGDTILDRLYEIFGNDLEVVE